MEIVKMFYGLASQTSCHILIKKNHIYKHPEIDMCVCVCLNLCLCVYIPNVEEKQEKNQNMLAM